MNEVSQKQLEANQQNALQSTGPKTQEGKVVSKYNALKHGLLSKEVLLAGEDEEVLIEIGKRLRTELEPETELEFMLVDRITANTWRLRRVMRVEREMMNYDLNGSDFEIVDTPKTLGKAMSINFAKFDTYGKLIRYEASIERGIYKALHELQRIQAARTGKKHNIPLAIDVDISEK
ncbi:MAG: hypothetical protein KKB81_02830 [Candidatus Margulisbacteria bacterium]|nr:hypothetical protein [Candidatus Margulisiibacteriota bacterium]MBU1022186.1 hypothetical protein [Candidatus Margulisiibacteriota bacterium]MBU1729375.1 hypothetical protein [Candidatus Margulisiibacteriota bacterium]MBU1955648.1 hypothetical protein [Candidatus Margulisiibacteriota bacterium]